MNKYLEEAQSMQDLLVKWRRDLHQIPEVGLNLPKTVKYVMSVLDSYKIDYEVKEDISCVIATIGKGGKCILLRSDMDGLPGDELSGESFAAPEGTFHGCGHDMHAANLLGAAVILKKHEDELPGTVKLIFQSAEEVFKGAAAAIDAGVLENPKVDAAFGMHVFATSPLGFVTWGDLFMGACYGFKINIHGVGGHGSQPESCVDPINAACHIYLALQELLARECVPQHCATLTIGHMEAGSVANVIPAEATMEGTLRTFEPETRAFLIMRINEIVPAIAAAYRCTVDIEVLSNVPCNSSDPEMTKDALESISDIITGNQKTKFMGSEDFAFYAEKVPSAFFGIGAAVDNPNERFGQHNPHIKFNETALYISVACYVSVAMDWLNKHI